ncbi:hypothetical protein [Mycobacterium sp. D16R24]|uniref:hypothetical protein n=1 Tax=Mycobacterium sp. D16R24 TaxID=1855656 RepID=UPI000992C299|nr:hypothetical protein [Mycobacterium sp. D16R24]
MTTQPVIDHRGDSAPATVVDDYYRRPPCQMGVTGYCLHGRHGECPYRPGGSLRDGIVLNECTVTFPGTRKDYRDMHAAHYEDGRTVQVVKPSHRYRCPCECHRALPVGQLELFGVSA